MSELKKITNFLQTELGALRKQQSDASKQAIYFPMTLEELKSFDERTDLIDKLHRELVKFQSAA